eukprot:Gb_25512 [translate_table: standard]
MSHFFNGVTVFLFSPFTVKVHRNVANSFSEQNVLVRDNFGIVYKGKLHDEAKIRVKRMETMTVSSKGVSDFQVEIKILTKVCYRNLVSLLGYYINENEKLLVYEYMPQGSPNQHLFDWCQNELPVD